MNDDPEIIKKSYEQLIQQIFDAYWNVFIENPTPGQIQQAERKFGDAVTKARHARDRAITLLPP